MDTWTEAYIDLQKQIENDSQFLTLVRCIGDRNNLLNTRRARVLANRICERLKLDPEVYRGNVYGAALAYQERRVEHRAQEDVGFPQPRLGPLPPLSTHDQIAHDGTAERERERRERRR